MSTLLRHSAWNFNHCLAGQRHGRRFLSTAAINTNSSITSSTTQSPSPSLVLSLASHTAPSSSQDDQTLRKVFDSQSFWQDFSQRHASLHRSHPRGLFQNRHLTNPGGFQVFASDTLGQARKLVAKITSASTVQEYRSLVRMMDRLSDLLCRVIDVADFVRAVHPDRRMQDAASKAHALMFEYMNVLNTTTALNDQLKKAMSMPEVVASWTQEEKVVADILRKDFSKSAIDLPSTARQRFVHLSNQISRVGQSFVEGMAAERPYLAFRSSKLKGLDPLLARQLTQWGRVTLPSTGSTATTALRSVEDEVTRKEIYLASRTATKAQIRRLEELVTLRAQLAEVSGYESFAQMTLSDKMARSPQSVDRFLEALAGGNRSRLKAELDDLTRLKESRVGPGAAPLQAWDKDFYTSRQMALARPKSRSPDFISAYFSLGTVMQGLSRVFHRLYGVRFVPREPGAGESWNDDVRRLDVVDEAEGHIAVVYCDLFERPWKNPNPAHYTLRCSRRISEEELRESVEDGVNAEQAEDAVTNGMASARHPNGELYQLPTIALICDFARGPSNRPTLLSYREVQTLFHEMGHAVHSMLGRTTLQNVSGTRCATDFAELPSVLMEHFLAAPEVLGLFARHWETDAPLPYQLVRDKMETDQRFAGTETEGQIVLAMLDQRYHSALPLSSGFDSTAIYRDVYDRYGSLREPVGTSWHGFFGHLYGYGATYYSYLFDRAIASKVWTDVFQRREGGALDREAGSLFREEVLRWGGGRDGWECIAGVLGRDDLAQGNGAAMAEVGKWGVKGSNTGII
ncbi:MAG: Mitochondrial intermediate peptidase [Caeruleum heppii]|nr:MAG: Mitochondrial intermediate peptidase [Caeruleum heppii]